MSVQTLDHHLERMSGPEGRGNPLPLIDIDFSFNRPEFIAQKFGRVFQYFTRVESEVGLLADRVKLMFAHEQSPEHMRRFVDIWTPEEEQHGQIFAQYQELIGVEQLPVEMDIGRKDRAVGFLSEHVAGFRRPMNLFYLARGAMHEKLTFGGYRRLIELLSEAGEQPIVDTALKPIVKQEASHLGYYRKAALQTREDLRSWEIQYARWLSMKLYSPVGADALADKVHFGEVASVLSDGDTQSLSSSVQEIGETLLNDGLALPQFVLRGIQDCVELARQD